MNLKQPLGVLTDHSSPDQLNDVSPIEIQDMTLARDKLDRKEALATSSSPISPLGESSPSVTAGKIHGQGGKESLEQTVHSQSSPSIDQQLEPEDTAQSSGASCASRTTPASSRTSHIQIGERKASKIKPTSGQTLLRASSSPRDTSDAGCRLRTAASAPCMSSPNGYNARSRAWLHRRSNDFNPLDGSLRAGALDSPSPCGQEDSFPWSPFDCSSQRVDQSAEYSPSTTDRKPYSMPSDFEHSKATPESVLYERVPRIDFASIDAVSRTQDIIEILDTVLWLARTHNGSGLKDIATYTEAFRTSSRHQFAY